MTDFTIRSDSVDVEQIMGRIRARIREKRGVDYTEQDLEELAAVKLEKFLDPEGVRSDLLAEFKKASSRPRVAPPAPLEPPADPLPVYSFEVDAIYGTHRSPLRWIRRLLRPVLKLFFNPNTLVHAIRLQARVNAVQEAINARAARVEFELLKRAHDAERARADREILTYEVLHNLAVELTRAGIEVKNLKMRVESLSSRLDFDERRARALEGIVEYRKDAGPPARELVAAPAEPAAAAEPAPAVPSAALGAGQAPAPGEGQRRRRRRRRGRRGGRRTGTAAPSTELGAGAEPAASPETAPPAEHESQPAEEATDTGDVEMAPASDQAATDASRSGSPDLQEDREAEDPGAR